MSIQKLLDKIKFGVSGKEIRGAIHDSIKKTYDHASIEKDNANMEVKMARGNSPTLNDRLNKVDFINDSLSHEISTKANQKELDKTKADLTDVGSRIDNIIATPTTVSEQEIIDARQGKDSLGANLDSIKQTVDIEIERNRGFIEHGQNLFNIETALEAKSVDSNGQIINESGRVLSDYIRVVPGETLYTSYVNFRYAEYDRQRNFISRLSKLDGQESFTVSKNTHEIRVSPTFRDTNLLAEQLMINRGSGPLIFEQYKAKLDTENKVDVELASYMFSDGIVKPRHTTFLKESNNLIDHTQATPDKGIQFNKGTIIDDTERVLTGYIPVTGGETLYHSEVSFRYNFLTKRKTVIFTGTSNNTETEKLVPHGVDYMQIAVLKEFFPTFMMNRGNELLPYEPYSIKFDDRVELPSVKDDQKLQQEPMDDLVFEVHSEQDFRPIGLSINGEIIFASKGHGLYKSLDNFRTFELVAEFDGGVGKVIELANGSLLVSIHPNESLGVKSHVMVSNDQWNEWEKTLELDYFENTLTHSWSGLSVHNNIVVCNEYGSKIPPTNANKVFLSEDYGKTFRVVYDGGLIDGMHIHGAEYDKWYKRIWVVIGDGSNKSIIFSDDLGKSWITATDDLQAVGVIPTEKKVLFTMDGAPNGIVGWERTSKEDRSLKFKPLYHLEPSSDQTLYVGQSNYTSPDGTIYMPVLPIMNGRKGYIFATKNGQDIYKVHEYETIGWQGITSLFNDSNNGLIGLRSTNDSEGNREFVRCHYRLEWKDK